MTDIKTDFMRTHIAPVAIDKGDELESIFTGLAERAEEWFDEEGIPEDGRHLLRRIEMRYAGQNFELSIDIPEDATKTPEAMAEIIESFHRAHERVYGYRSPEAHTEAVTFRVQAVGYAPKVELHTSTGASEDASSAIVASRDVYFDADGGFRACSVYDRGLLAPLNRIEGPAVIEQMDTTTVLLPGDVCVVDSLRNLVIEIGK